MKDWIEAFVFLLAMVAGCAGCLSLARLSWRRSQNGKIEGWLALSALALLWSGLWLPPIVEVGHWLVSHVWLLS